MEKEKYSHTSTENKRRKETQGEAYSGIKHICRLVSQIPILEMSG